MRKVALVGTSVSCKDAPFNDPSWEIWGTGCSPPPRWDRWFQLHNEETLRSPLNKEHWDWMCAQRDGVIYLPRHYDEISCGVTYGPPPTAEFGTWFFTSTISYMLAMAIQEQVGRIGLWGIDLSDRTEYAHQKPGARFFIQVARMRGIEVVMPPGCEVDVPGRLYGLDPPSLLEGKIAERMKELRLRIDGENATVSELLTKRAALMGAIQIKAPQEELEGKIAEIDGQLEQKKLMIAALDGALQDQDHIRTNWI